MINRSTLQNEEAHSRAEVGMALEQTTLVEDDTPLEQLTLVEVDGEQRIRMGYDDYLQLSGEGLHAEWVNGEVIIFKPPTIRHQLVLIFLSTLIDTFVGLFRLGVTLAAPCEVRLLSKNSSREPDVLFVANEHRDRIAAKRVEGAPDLVVELLSPESVHRDRVDKYDEYEKAGVREYWIIDPRPEHARAWFYVLGEDGQYKEATLRDRRFYSTVLPGFWLQVDWLWQEELPTLMHCLRAIVGAQAMINSIMGETGSDQP
jgi:Uma2 family endonuclease